MTKKPFVPRDKPKSWVVAILSGIVGVLLGGPVMVAGAVFDVEVVGKLGTALFLLCWLVFAVMWATFMLRQIMGRYKGLKESEWSEQLW